MLEDLHKFKLSNLQLTENLALFNITDSLKQSKPNCKPLPVIFHKYPHNEQLFPVWLVQMYLEKQTSLSSVVSPFMQNMLGYHWKISCELVNGNALIVILL